MVQPTDLVGLDHVATLDSNSMRLAALRTVHSERLVRPPAVVVAQVVGEHPLQGPLLPSRGRPPRVQDRNWLWQLALE
jgi:hypothetical protein